MTISLLLPTRGRPVRLGMFLDSLIRMSRNTKLLEIVLYIDSDDPCVDDVWDVVRKPDLDFKIIEGPRVSMGEMLNSCFHLSNGQVVGLVNDDIIIETEGWDQIIEDQFELCREEYLLLYPADGFHKKGFPAFPFFNSEFLRRFESPFPRYEGSHIDTHMIQVFQRLSDEGMGGIVYAEKIMFRHLHYRLDNSLFDETYAARDRFGDDRYYLSLLPLIGALPTQLKNNQKPFVWPDKTYMNSGLPILLGRVLLMKSTASMRDRLIICLRYIARAIYAKMS